LLHDNAKPHTAKLSRQKIEELGWEVLPHAPYSPDLAPSDFHLFRALSNFLKEKHFNNLDHLKNDIQTFFESKTPEFYAEGILQLPQRWEMVLDSDGEYIID
jgi:transposase